MEKECNLPLTIILADMNGLKLINDSFGHTAGDELLIKAAEAIKIGGREDDIVARIGGDEFGIILTETQLTKVEEIMNRIRASIDKYKDTKNVCIC